jgi:hypothetical protein
MYLISNVGARCYNSIDLNSEPRQILMRIDNYFIDGLPIIAHNTEFTATVVSASLADVWFRLVDANFVPIKLLNPLFLSAMAMDIPDVMISRPIMVSDNDSAQSASGSMIQDK